MLKLSGVLIAVFSLGCFATPLTFKADMKLRLDHRTQSDSRYQYRLRVFPQWQLAQDWDLLALASTGNAFASSHNTVNASNNQKFNLRRLYVRQQNQDGKTELGVIPTYKGRVSSTGLSKDGWITGLRHVSRLPQGELEWVVGELENDLAPGILRRLDKLNYYEVEYSHKFSQYWSAEIALDHMLDDNFARAEVRYVSQNQAVYALEFINKLDNNKFKLVVSLEQQHQLYDYAFSSFSYYTYASLDFGTRAELTEDFVDFGHALVLEFKGKLSDSYSLSWFAKSEFYQEQNRYQFGLQYKY